MSSVLDSLDALEAKLGNVQELQGAATSAHGQATRTDFATHHSTSTESKRNLETLSMLKVSSGSRHMQVQKGAGGGVAATSANLASAHSPGASNGSSSGPMRESLFLGPSYGKYGFGISEPDASETTGRAPALEQMGESFEAQDGAFRQADSSQEAQHSVVPFSYSPSRADLATAHADIAPVASAALLGASTYNKWPTTPREAFYTQADDDALNRTLDAWAASDGTMDRGQAAQAATGVSRQTHAQVRAAGQGGAAIRAQSDVDRLYGVASLRDSPGGKYTMGGASPPPPPVASLGKPAPPYDPAAEGKAASSIEFSHENGSSSFTLSHRTLPAGMASAGDTGRYRATVAAAMSSTLSAQLQGAEEASRLQLALKARDALDAIKLATRQKLAVSGDATSQVGHWSPARQQAAGEVRGRLQSADDAANAAELSNTRLSASLEEGSWRTGGAAAPQGWALDTALPRSIEDMTASDAAGRHAPTAAQRMAAEPSIPPSAVGTHMVLPHQYTDEQGATRQGQPMQYSDTIRSLAQSEHLAAGMASEAYITQSQLATLRRAHVLSAATRSIPQSEIAPHIFATKPPTPSGTQSSPRSFFQEEDTGTFASSQRRQAGRAAQETQVAQEAHSPGAITDLTSTLHGMFSSAPFAYRRGPNAGSSSGVGSSGLWVTPRDAPVGMDREALTAAFPHSNSTAAWRGAEGKMGPGACAGRSAVGGLSAPLGGSMPALDAQAHTQREALAQRAADEAAAARANAAAAAKQAAEAARVRAAQIASTKVKLRSPAAARASSRKRSATVAVGARPKPAAGGSQRKQRSGSTGGGAGMSPLDHMTDFAKLSRQAPGAGQALDVEGTKPPAPKGRPPPGTVCSPSPKKAGQGVARPPPPSVPRAVAAGSTEDDFQRTGPRLPSSKFYATSVRLGAERYTSTTPGLVPGRRETTGTLVLSDSGADSDSDTDSTATMSSGGDTPSDTYSQSDTQGSKSSLFANSKNKNRHRHHVQEPSSPRDDLVARAAGVAPLAAAPARGKASRRASATMTATRAVNKKALLELASSKPRSAADIIRRKRMQASLDAQTAVANADHAAAKGRIGAGSSPTRGPQPAAQAGSGKALPNDAISSTQAAQLGSLMHLVGAHVDGRGVPADGSLPPARALSSAATLLGQQEDQPEHFLPPFSPSGGSVADTLAMSHGTHSSLRALAQAARSELQAHNEYTQRQENIKALFKKKAELLASCGYPQLALRVLQGEQVDLPPELTQGQGSPPQATPGAAHRGDVSTRGKQVGKFYVVPSFPEYNSKGVEVQLGTGAGAGRGPVQPRDGPEALARAVLFGDGDGGMESSAHAELMAAGGALHPEVHDRSVWMQATFKTGESSSSPLRNQGLYQQEQTQLDAAQRYKLTNVVVPDGYFTADADGSDDEGGAGQDKGRGHPMFGLAAKDMPPIPVPKSPHMKGRSASAVVPFGVEGGDGLGELPGGGGSRFAPPVSPTGRSGKRWSVPPQMLAAHDQRMAQAYASEHGSAAGGTAAVPGMGQRGFSLDGSDFEHLGISDGGLSGRDEQRARSRKAGDEDGDTPQMRNEAAAHEKRPQLQVPSIQQTGKQGPDTPARPGSRASSGNLSRESAAVQNFTPPKPHQSPAPTPGEVGVRPAPKAKRTTPPKPVSPSPRPSMPRGGIPPRTPPRGGPVAARPTAGGPPRTPPRGGPVAARPTAGGPPRTPPRGGPVAARPVVASGSKAPAALQLDDNNWL